MLPLREFQAQRHKYDKIDRQFTSAMWWAVGLTWLFSRPPGREWIFYCGIAILFALILCQMALYWFWIDPLVRRQFPLPDLDEKPEPDPEL